MRLGKGKRRALAALGFLFAILLLILASVPVWWPWALRTVGSHGGLRFADYETKGYTHLLLHGLSFTNDSVQLRAKEADVLTPTIWLWRCLTGPGESPSPCVSVKDWNLKLAPQPVKQESPPPPSSTYTNVAQITEAIRPLNRWLLAAELSDGAIELDRTKIQLPRVTWKAGELSASVEIPSQKQRGMVRADLKKTPYKIEIQSESAGLQSAVTIALNSAGLDLQANGSWQTNTFQSEAHFGRTGALPETADFKVPQFHLPAEALHLPQYREISGSVEGIWTNGEYEVQVAANGMPASTSTNLPPVQINLSARGNTNLLIVQTGKVSSPWLQADISPGATVHFKGPILQQPANVRVRMNLDGQPWIKAHGSLAGEIDLKSGSEKYPDTVFRLSGTNVGTPEIDAKAFSIEGKTHGTIIKISRADAVVDDSSAVHVEGGFDWAARTISSGKATVKGPAAGRWLPAGYGYDNGLANVRFEGPITNLSHQGHAVLTNLTVPNLEPLQVSLDWQGQRTSVQRTEVQVTSGDTALQTVFSAEISNPMGTNSGSRVHGQVALDTLLWNQRDTHVFALQKPARFVFEEGTGTNEWFARIENFAATGAGGGLRIAADIHWPQRGVFELFATNTSTELINYFRNKPVEPGKIVRLDVAGGWTNGPMSFDVDGVAETTVQSKVPSPKSQVQSPTQGEAMEAISAKFNLHGDGDGLTITNLNISSQTSVIAVAHGSLPLTIVPAAGTNLIRLETKKPANFSLRTQPQSLFWEKLSEWTGVVLKEPSMSAEVSGTWEAPRGRVLFTAQAIQLPAKSSNLPRMEHLELDLGLDREVATLTNLSLLVQGQPVTATARMPLGEKFWEDVKQKKPPNWQSATGRLQIKEAQIAAFSSLLPSLLAPQGTFHLDASLQPGGKLEGELVLKQARTRPLPSVGPIRDIDVSLRLAGHTIKLAEAAVTVGGSPVMAAGEADLSGTKWLQGGLPPFEFVLFGTNVPLSRQPESILRSDLNLAIKKTNGAPPLISGTVRLRDSYYLSDLGDLVPGKMASPDQRPPYFTVTETNLADWRLAIRVGGERALKVRSTLFNGQVSPNLRVQGTLKEPLALGDVKIENGTVRFPFASLEVQRGYVTLNSENPYRPNLMITAASKKFGYDVRMEITGPADQPIIQFNSTPPLSSEQLVLMVTAGELPKGGYTLTPSQRAQTMALFLGKDLLSRLGAGDQSEERLNFTSGQEISETGKPTYSLEYKVTKRWSLVGEYDRFNAFNAGIKWKLYSK